MFWPFLILLACLASSTALLRNSPQPTNKPRRIKKNKYAHFSKAEEVQKSLRFSSLETKAPEGVRAVVDEAPAVAQTRERNVWLYPDEAHIDQRDPTTFGFVEIGRILGAHGVRGELKVSTDSDFAVERLCTPGVRWLRRPKRRAPREVRLAHGRAGPGSGMFIIRLEDVARRDEAQALKGSYLYSRREILPELDSDELLVSQLEGLTVALVNYTDGAGSEPEAGKVIGRVRGVVPREELTGSPELGNDLLEVELFRGDTLDDGPERSEDGELDTVLVPHVLQIVPAVLQEQGLLLIDPPEGLLDLVQPKRKERVFIRGLLPERAQSLVERSEPPS